MLIYLEYQRYTEIGQQTTYFLSLNIRVKHQRGKMLNNCIPMTLCRLSIGSLKINQQGRQHQHSQEAEKNLLADEKGHWKGGGGRQLSVYTIYYRSVPLIHNQYFFVENMSLFHHGKLPSCIKPQTFVQLIQSMAMQGQDQGYRGIRQWPINLCTSQMMSHKIPSSVE